MKILNISVTNAVINPDRKDFWPNIYSQYMKGLCMSVTNVIIVLHQVDLSQHKQSIHEYVEYACNQYDYKARHHVNLSQHKQSLHEGVWYYCNHWKYKAKSRIILHPIYNQEGIQY